MTKRRTRKSKGKRKSRKSRKIIKGGDPSDEIIRAIKNCDFDDVKKIIDLYPESLYTKDPDNNNILHLTCIKYIDIISYQAQMRYDIIITAFDKDVDLDTEEELNSLENITMKNKKILNKIFKFIIEKDFAKKLINERNNSGETPLFAATKGEFINGIIALIRNGANVLAANNANKRAKHYAKTTQIANFLESFETRDRANI